MNIPCRVTSDLNKYLDEQEMLEMQDVPGEMERLTEFNLCDLVNESMKDVTCNEFKKSLSGCAVRWRKFMHTAIKLCDQEEEPTKDDLDDLLNDVLFVVEDLRDSLRPLHKSDAELMADKQVQENLRHE